MVGVGMSCSSSKDDFCHVHSLQQYEQQVQEKSCVVRVGVQPVLLYKTLIPAEEPGQVHRFTLKQGLWSSWSCSSSCKGVVVNQSIGNTISYTTAPKDPFPLVIPKGGCIEGPSYRELVLMDPWNDEPCATVIKEGNKFSIFGFEPYTSKGQPAAAQKCGKSLYKWGNLTMPKKKASFRTWRTFSTRLFTLEMANARTLYRAERVSASPNADPGKCPPFDYRIFAANAKPQFQRSSSTSSSCSSGILGAKLQQQGNDWNLIIGPGIDPTLIIAFAAILDEILTPLVVGKTISFTSCDTVAEQETVSQQQQPLTEAPHIQVELPPAIAVQVGDSVYEVVVPTPVTAEPQPTVLVSLPPVNDQDTPPPPISILCPPDARPGQRILFQWPRQQQLPLLERAQTAPVLNCPSQPHTVTHHSRHKSDPSAMERPPSPWDASKPHNTPTNSNTTAETELTAPDGSSTDSTVWVSVIAPEWMNEWAEEGDTSTTTTPALVPNSAEDPGSTENNAITLEQQDLSTQADRLTNQGQLSNESASLLPEALPDWTTRPPRHHRVLSRSQQELLLALLERERQRAHQEQHAVWVPRRGETQELMQALAASQLTAQQQQQQQQQSEPQQNQYRQQHPLQMQPLWSESQDLRVALAVSQEETRQPLLRPVWSESQDLRAAIAASEEQAQHHFQHHRTESAEIRAALAASIQESPPDQYYQPLWSESQDFQVAIAASEKEPQPLRESQEIRLAMIASVQDEAATR